VQQAAVVLQQVALELPTQAVVEGVLVFLGLVALLAPADQALLSFATPAQFNISLVAQ
jgi:hypothetical protein